MKPPPFEYYRPGSLDEAVQRMARYGPDAKILAGGQSLLPMLAMRQAQSKHLVDLQRVGELAGIRNADGRIGAMVRQWEIERDSSVPPLVRCAVRHIGNFEVRNRGTVGGSLSYLDPAAEAARQSSQVLSEAQNEPMTNWPGLIVLTLLPTSAMMPTYS